MRRLILEMDYHTGEGHIGGAMSAADILAALFFGVMEHSPERFANGDAARDRFVMSKGHISDAYYAALALSGYIPVEELKTYCAVGSRLSGHPTNKVPGIEMNTGALGHGLSNAVGMALAAKLDKSESRAFVLLGDGELAEGSVWEAAMSAGHYGLDNLTAIVDRNGLQIGGKTEDLMSLEPLADKWSAFGWEVKKVDGHNIADIIEAIESPRSGKPRAIIAETIKGKGVSYMENVAKWHHGTPTNEEYLQAVSELNGKIAQFDSASPHIVEPKLKPAKASSGKSYISAREAIMKMLTERAKTDERIVTLTSDARGSASMGSFIKEHPERFFEIGIAEQNEVGVAAGLAVSGKIPFVAAPASFIYSRSYEQVKSDLAYSHANVKLVAVSGGAAYGVLGQTHHSLQDIATLRALPDMRVVIPADAVSARVLAERELDINSPVYIRVGRAATPPIYSEELAATIEPGEAVTLRTGKDGCIISSGIMLLTAMRAASLLSEEGIEITVIDMHTIKPLDTVAIRNAAKQFGRLATIEEHVLAGGLGSAVCEVESEYGTPVKCFAFPDENAICAEADDIYSAYGLTPENVAEELKKWLGK